MKMMVYYKCNFAARIGKQQESYKRRSLIIFLKEQMSHEKEIT